MKFINKSNKNVEVRIGKRFDYSWITVKPGKTIDLPKEKGMRYEFEKVLENKSKPKVTEGKIGKTKVETKQISKKKIDDYKRKLVLIKGISSKTSKDIIKVFPTEKDLLKAISNKESIPFRDDIEKKLRNEYGR